MGTHDGQVRYVFYGENGVRQTGSSKGSHATGDRINLKPNEC